MKLKFLIFLLYFGLQTCLVFAQQNIVVESDSIENEYEDNYDEDEYNYDEDEDYVEEATFQQDTTYRAITNKSWEKIKNDKKYIYKKDKKEISIPKIPLRKKNTFNFLDASFLKILLYIIVAVVIMIAIYFFFKNNDISFRKNVKTEETYTEAPWEDVKQYDQWDVALQQALKEKNYRLAVRILYLKSLQKLDSAGYINYHSDTTNWQYVSALQETTLYAPFTKLTTYFDFIWYGSYNLNEEMFNTIHNEFNIFLKQFMS